MTDYNTTEDLADELYTAKGRRNKFLMKKQNKLPKGRAPIRARFIELTEHHTEGVTPDLSLEEFHRVFMEEMDMTEYKPAIRLLGSVQEWEVLKMNCKDFRDAVDNWKKEVQVKITSLAQEKIFNLLDSDNENIRINAAKWIAEGKMDASRKRGRPSRTEIANAKKEVLRDAKITKEELERVEKFKVINGGK